MNKKRLPLMLAFLFLSTIAFSLFLAGCGTPGEVSAIKTCSLAQGQTLSASHQAIHENSVAPGGSVTYTFELTNVSENKARVEITDTIPQGTKVVAGDFDSEGTNLSWKGRVKAGKTKTVSYTLQVTGGDELYNGGVISGTNAKVDGVSLVTNDVYIEKTLNHVDTYYTSLATKVFTKFDYYSGIDLAGKIYTAAFTNSTWTSKYSDDLDVLFANLTSTDSNFDTLKDTVAPSMFGGTQLTQAIPGVKGQPNAMVNKADMIIGDLLFVQNENDYLYIVGEDKELYDLNNALVKADTQTILDSLSLAQKYALVRPSIAMTNFTPGNPNEKQLNLNENQRGLLQTAESFFLRGDNMQYEDTTFINVDQERSSFGKTPEFYTYHNTGYSNCAMFTFDVYYSTFGQAIPGNLWTTMALANNSKSQNIQVFQATQDQLNGLTETQMQTTTKEIFALIQPGDLFTIRRTSGTGHVMMYIGNGRFVHSGGSTLRKPSDTRPHVEDVREATVRYHKIYDYLFDASATNYLYGGTITSFTITRPTLNQYYKQTITDQAKARLNNLKGVRVDKLSSHTLSTTVNAGDEITYTFSIFNTNKTPVTLEIKDKAPENTTYLTGAQNNENGNLSWTVTVEGNQTATVSYKVKVNENVADRTMINGQDATVGGVSVACPAISVRNTLKTTEQAQIVQAVNTLKAENTTLGGFELINAIYQKAVNKNAFDCDLDTLLGKNNSDGLFYYSSAIKVSLNNYTTTFKKYMVRNLYGGTTLTVDTYVEPFIPNLNYNTNSFIRRTEVVTEYNLIVGDVLLAQIEGQMQYFIYVGDKTFVNLNNGIANDTLDFTTRCVRLLESDLYAVVRPSMSF